MSVQGGETVIALWVLSQLLAEEALSREDWERAVRVLAECRAERTRLGRRLIHLDATVALMWDCDL